MPKFLRCVALILGALSITGSARAATYLFRVDCSDASFIARWDTVAPGRDKTYFRSATGTLNLNCSIYDYDQKTDRLLPQRACGDPGDVINAFPAALILAGATHCS